MKTTIVLVRHGETDWNKRKKIQGQTDIPLSEEGARQVKALAKRVKTLGITKIYTSKLKRAIQTAEILAEEAKLAIEDKLSGFNERRYGIFEGKGWDFILQHYPDKDSFFTAELKGGESQQDFKKRVLKTFQSIVKKHQGEKILIVCHGGVITQLIWHLKNDSDEPSLHLFNTCLSIFHLEENGKVIEEVVGDVSHL
jgi:probable phosphoglycerate mutase